MLLKANKKYVTLMVVLLCMIQCEIAVCYRSEIEITPAPPNEEETTKKSGFFGGIKNFFRSSSTTTVPSILDVTTARNAAPVPQVPHQTASQSIWYDSNVNAGAQKPPPLVIPQAPLMPLGPRPDTPSSSPFGGSNQQQPPQWPQASPSSTTTMRTQSQFPQQHPPQHPQRHDQQYPSQTGGASTFGTGPRPDAAGGQPPNFPTGFAPYHPPKSQPSGFDLSYGSGAATAGGRPQHGGRPGFGLAPITSSTSTTTASPKPAPSPQMNVDLRGGFDVRSTTTTTPPPLHPKEDFPPLPPPRRSSLGAKEDFPPLPTAKSPSTIPASPPFKPSSPAAMPAHPTSTTFQWAVGGSTTPFTPPLRPISPAGIPHPTPSSPHSPTPATVGGNRVAFVPHAPAATDRTTTARPGARGTDDNLLATDDEIQTLTENLYNKEVNSQMNLIRVNVQGKTRSIDKSDEAPQPLLDVDAKVFEVPTIAKMHELFNNYEDDTLTNEHVTPNERKEENEFLDAIMATSVMRQAMQFLQSKGIVSPDPKTHRDLVKELWFTQYSRGSGRIGSSGFEHVFVHEVKNGTLIGLHNWVYFHEEEKAERLDYQGYIQELDLGTKAKLVKMRFIHKGVQKPVNTLFIGTSPEMEMALYTVCFQLRPDKTCPVSLGNTKFGILTYSWRYRGKNLIGSAFPDIPYH